MTGLLNNETITIECPSCGHKLKQRLGGLDNNKLMRCICGANITATANHKGGAAQTLKTVNKGLQSLETALKKLGK